MTTGYEDQGQTEQEVRITRIYTGRTRQDDDPSWVIYVMAYYSDGSEEVIGHLAAKDNTEARLLSELLSWEWDEERDGLWPYSQP